MNEQIFWCNSLVNLLINLCPQNANDANFTRIWLSIEKQKFAKPLPRKKRWENIKKATQMPKKKTKRKDQQSVEREEASE